MKLTRKWIGILLCCVFLCTVAAGCGSGTGYSFTCEDATNSTPEQQKWLKCPGSVMVINPNAIAGEDQRDMTKDPLSFGIQDDSGATVAAYDDALFLLETASANGRGGKVLEDINWETAKGLSKVEVVDQASRLAFTIPEGFKGAVTAKNPSFYNVKFLDPNYYVKVDVDSVPEKGSVYLEVQAVHYLMDSDVMQKQGSYFFSMKNIATRYAAPTESEEGEPTNFFIKAEGKGQYVINSVQLIEYDTGYHAAAKAASTVWNPYSIKASVEFPNDSAVETLDYFFNENTLVRKVTPVKASDIGFAGKIYGTCTYDESNATLCFENGSSRYAIFLKKGYGVDFYATYEDLLAGTNAMTEPSGAAYWAQTLVGLTADEEDKASFYIGVSGSASMSMADLVSSGSNCVSVTKARKVYSVMEDFWNEYIPACDISEYITVIPE